MRGPRCLHGLESHRDPHSGLRAERPACARLCACVRARARACGRAGACVRACVRACVSARPGAGAGVHACARLCVHAHMGVRARVRVRACVRACTQARMWVPLGPRAHHDDACTALRLSRSGPLTTEKPRGLRAPLLCMALGAREALSAREAPEKP